MSEANYSRKDVLNEAKKLGQMMADTEEVAFFKQAEEKINQNLKVQQLIKQIKDKQKEAVNLQHYQKGEALKAKEKEIDELHEEIDQIPLVQEFKQSQTEVNELLQLVSNTISRSVTNQIIEDTGGDKLKGTTGRNPFQEIRNKS
ncbi:RicAFT regulatory complex protein RicA family protein [Salsuginibacillus kocurii]|uniref:RicAFT regulatory complex protein RicA family protein n=1 Tax=Salsuginibacillus kocurii TaxID=427078 RepID=UPI00036AA933|nr:YlbF family regulator [Salsuginibacillus kocurii]